jgi:outer membrane lipoprotein SlyB
MSRTALAISCLLALGLEGCAVSGGLSTASVSVEGNDLTVRSSEWGGSVACGHGDPSEPACSAETVRREIP